MKLACIDVIRRENAACQRSGRDNDMDLFGNLETVTYKTGRRKVLKVMSGTALADRLLQMAMDPDIKTVATGKAVGTPSQKHSHTAGKAMFKLGKNQLPQGRYMFGTDLPVGTFDFTWVWGSGSIGLYGTAENTTLGNCLYSECRK